MIRSAPCRGCNLAAAPCKLPMGKLPKVKNHCSKGRQVARSNLESVSCEKDQQQMGRPNKNDLSRLERILMKSRNEDLNLAALISAVEKDIWYMEQLEQNPSVLRRKNRYSD